MRTLDHYTADLIEYLLAVKTPDQMEQALRELLTPAEFTEITKRLQIFKMLEAGVPQRKIAEELGVGIATVSRGARARKLDYE
ncbi:Trp family transcriptional regulator [Gynuella sunshinyii]|uniref:Trp operon repressor n=1 Tax=Gynuella sunshinyii YC6258 TaxID=1445510 RepID=A0A0C5VQ60_9GAMM|nr:Trp family transcriptional regulator [Gynuella sunshinyii]AJQ96396.1 trp operon repressor [Gynuella sunshinyii YC6258]